MISHWNASSGGTGALARPRPTVRLVLALGLAAVASVGHAAPPQPGPAEPPTATASADVRLVAANAMTASAVFAVDGQLQSVKRGERVLATELRLVHVGASGALIERIDAQADGTARFQLAVGATLPPLPVQTPPDSVPARTAAVVSSRSVQSRQGADTDAPTQ